MNTLPPRVVALDAFRGLTIALMILVNTPGSWSHIYAPLKHAPWEGCTLTDLVFPFFLFIVGAAMRFSFGKYNYDLSADLLKKIVSRTLIIFAVGLALAAYPFIRQDWDWSTFRIMGVLQRIALAYGIGALLCVGLSRRNLWITSGVVLVGYWLIMWIGGGRPDPFSLENNFARKFDLLLLGAGHVWGGFGVPFDPEGLLSTLPAVITVVLGYQVGIMIQTANDQRENVKNMILFGAVLGVLGLLWGLVFPIAKPIWTSSYVLYTAGWATLVLAALIWLIDIRGFRKPAQPFVIFGTNSIFVFAASGLWVKTIVRIPYTLNGESVNGYQYLYQTVFQPLAGDVNGSLLFALAHVLMWWLVLAYLYRHRIFIKI